VVDRLVGFGLELVERSSPLPDRPRDAPDYGLFARP
jgi:hypothetical protein